MNLRTPLLPGILVFILSLCLYATPEKSIEFHQWLATSLHAKTTEDSILRLENYIFEHNGPYEACSILEEWYLKSNRPESALTFYTDFSKSASGKWLGQWRLARYKSVQNAPRDIVLFHFNSAMQSAPKFHPQLVSDFIRYCLEKENITSLTDLKRRISQEKIFGFSKAFIAAIYNYHFSKYEDALTQFERLSNSEKQDPYLMLIWGYSFEKLGDSTAFTIWEKAIKHAKTLGQLHFATALQCRYGDRLYKRGYHQKGKEQLIDALKRAEKIQAPKIIAEAAAHLSDIHKFNQDYDKVIPLAEQSVAYSELIRDLPRKIDGLRNLAYAQLMETNFTATFRAYQEASSIAEKKSEGLRKLLLDRAHVYIYLDQFPFAQNDLSRLIYDYTENTDNRFRGNIADINGRIALGLNKPGVAKIHLQDAIRKLNSSQLKENDTYSQHAKLGEAYVAMKQYDEAVSSYEKAIHLARSAQRFRSEPWYHLGLAQIQLKRGQHNKALSRLDIAMASAVLAGNQSEKIHPDLYWNEAMIRGDIVMALGNINDAIQLYMQAADTFEAPHLQINSQQLQRSYFKGGKGIYERLAESYRKTWTMEPSYESLNKILYYFEMGRSRALKERFIESGKIIDSPKMRDIASDMDAARSQLRAGVRKFVSNAKLQDIQNQLNDHEINYMATELAIQREHQRKLPDLTITADSLQTIARRLNCSILQFQISENESFVYATTDSSSELIHIDAAYDSLVFHVNKIIRPLQSPADELHEVQFFSHSAHWLYSKLILPVETVLTSSLKKRVVIIPDDELIQLPFPALLTDSTPLDSYRVQDPPEAYKDLFLANCYIFNVLPTITQLNPLSQTPISSNLPFSMFLNPVQDPEGAPENDDWHGDISDRWHFSDIRTYTLERDRIKRVAPHAVPIEKSEATEPLFYEMLKKEGIVHLTTHGINTSSFEAYEGLLFASEDEKDGIAFAYEIAQQDSFSSRLLLVNACETLSKAESIGEGLVGLPREFFAAGISSVIVTRWLVYTGYSNAFTPRFYQKLLKNELPPDSALALAQRELIENSHGLPDQGGLLNFEHPYFWAPYVLYGSPMRYNRSIDPITSENHSFPWNYIVLLSIIAFILLLLFKVRKNR
ncbi:MAG: CHAT domain-containing protein [Calditrichia bacterium]